MTIPTEVSRKEYTGNGVTTEFAYTFKIFDQDDLDVYEIDTDGGETLLTISTHYTVTEVGDPDGGNVVLNDPLTDQYQLRIERTVAVKQPTDIRTQGGVSMETHENAWDYIVMICQQLYRLASDMVAGVLPWTTIRTYTTAEMPAAAEGWLGRIIIVKDPGQVGVSLQCGPNLAEDGYEWYELGSGTHF